MFITKIQIKFLRLKSCSSKIIIDIPRCIQTLVKFVVKTIRIFNIIQISHVIDNCFFASEKLFENICVGVCVGEKSKTKLTQTVQDNFHRLLNRFLRMNSFQ